MPKLSFRQVGRASTTDVQPTVKQALRRERRNASTAEPAIPSKFAKVPYSPPNKAKSFGSSASRFGRSNSATNPGPGYYLTDKVTSLVKNNASVSHRGFGNGFASKSRRFDRMALDRINFPAPGQYSAGNNAQSFDGSRRAVTAASFKSQTERCNYMDAFKTDAPAPGTYSLGQKKRRKQKLSASSFKSKTKRSTYIDELIRDSPAPGSYNPKVPADFRKDAIRYAAFRSTGPRLPKWGNSLPGPGEYNPVNPSKTKSSHSVGRGGSSSFANTNTDRWGTPYERKVALPDPNPGPGAYTPAFVKQKPKKTSSSWAKSAVLRGVQRPKQQPPGPSYYKPAKMGKRSFHLNVTGSFH